MSDKKYLDVYKFRGRYLLTKGNIGVTFGLSGNKVNSLIEDGTIESIQLEIPYGYDSELHELKFVVRNNVPRYELENAKTLIILVDGRLLIGTGTSVEDRNGTTVSPVAVDKYLIPFITTSWSIVGRDVIPSNLPEVSKRMEEVLLDGLETKRLSIISSISIEERMNYPLYAEAALRVVNGRPYKQDLELFKVEADIRQDVTWSELAERTHEKYTKDIMTNRKIQGIKSRVKSTFKKEYVNFDELKQAYLSIRTLINKTLN